METQVVTRQMLVGGKWMSNERTFEVFDSHNNEVIAHVPSATEEEMLKAIEEAERTVNQRKILPVHERIRILTKVSEYMEAHHETFAVTIAREGSKTITEARSEVTRATETIRISAEEARRMKGETINFDQNPGSENRVGYFKRFPVGIVGAITPFNDPLNLVAHKIGPAIAAGNAIILKPASATPLSALKLAEAFVEAGLPGGYLSVITGSGKEIGDTLVTHPAIKMISFTGGANAGEAITKKVGTKKVSMELGSNSPVIVLQDADLPKAVHACCSGAFSAAGQNCIGVQRIYVERSVYAEFLDGITEASMALNVGDKMNERTDVGPMINEKEAVRVAEWVNQAVEQGAKIETGGVREGAYYSPTVLTNVSPDSTIAKEEVFGPVVIVEPIDDLEQAIEKANAVNYGLHAGIFTKDLNKAFQAIEKIDVGGIMINDSSDYRIDEMPFGGTKGSGIGREGIKYSMDSMTEQKVVCFNIDE
ncbi:aldehyde dehydrogenase family protein [Halobacillus karajensis]|uniref:3-sulfolactaldehyde dehydrogenase n=1 Tax=Halobacillus karajensis TaxID=195088 RepID=A0A059NZ56_9BACI|nr:aldehyde dehydrogenase family protein [Halobacillus karajensis]CDQ18626.1 Succinate-semialdehyde dehydrogenase [NADP(+)] GabD [Halobacillus karajensis]CDQ23302.1 Succinate-semialdehyde dehydrogenase [NADP(+)] GabD [Halobacillus karajensis]CDQ26784.1 Succinate-semialdehyde dehydrogenase [NADP(+)] GabD [Halobacillus karajensis]